MNRNSPCPCLSGKKYKRCCVFKQEKIPKSASGMSQVTYTTERILDERYDRPSISDQEIIESLYHRLRYRPNTIKSEKDEYFQALNRLREKYTNLPSIWNYITMGYNVLGLDDKVRDTVFETYERFPKYLFSMTAIANVYLKEKKPEKTLEIFGNAKSLSEMYPDRKVFHVTEGRAFHHTIAYYYCIKGEIELAQNQLKLLEMVSEMMEFENDPLVKQIRKEIKKLTGSSDGGGLGLLRSILGW